jgi:hypothetical protein
MKKTLQALVARYPDKIEEVSDEGGGEHGDGYWLYLKPGWKRDLYDEVHNVHEWNMRDLVRAMRYVAPCACDECLRLKAVAK